MTIYFDTETTGLKPGRIIQLSYIIDDGVSAKGKNFYFAVDYVPIESVKIHGISTEKLKVLSQGKTFSDYQDEIFNDFISADLIVSHNFRFDRAFMDAEFSYLDTVFRFKASLDSMQYFTPIMKLPRNSGGYKYPKLSEVAEFSQVYSYDVLRCSKELFNTYDVSFHDARFDTATLYLCMKRQAENDSELAKVI